MLDTFLNLSSSRRVSCKHKTTPRLVKSFNSFLAFIVLEFLSIEKVFSVANLIIEFVEGLLVMGEFKLNSSALSLPITVPWTLSFSRDLKNDTRDISEVVLSGDWTRPPIGSSAKFIMPR